MHAQVRQREVDRLVELVDVDRLGEIAEEAGRHAALDPSPALISLLETRLKQMDLAAHRKDVMLYYETNLQFHWDLVSATGNQQICDVYRGVVQKLHLARLKNLSSDIGMLSSIREHHAIVDAIQRAQPDTCQVLTTNHVKAAAERLHQLTPTGDTRAKKAKS